jgi:S1-C subfamily serine protease
MPLASFQEYFVRKVEGALESVVEIRGGAYYGSGVCVDPKGLVLTNLRIVSSAESPRVIFLDGRNLAGKLVVSDPGLDACLLRIEGGGSFPAMAMERSSSIDRGDWVAVLGIPYRQEGSVSLGIVNARDRIAGRGVYQGEALFLDAPINPGMEGGAVVSASGRLVGLVGQLQFDERTHDEIAFAVPVEALSGLLERVEVASSPHETHPLAGSSVRFREIAERLAPSLVRIHLSLTKDPLIPVQRAAGPFTGLVVGSEGEVVTSLALLEGTGPEAIRVETWDGKTYLARLFGRDYRRDLALLRVEVGEERLPVPSFAGPGEVRVGQRVLALGTSFGPCGSPSMYPGIVSGVERQQRAVQTDASLLRGNRGGALVDLEGRVAGLLVQLLDTLASENSGVAFALPWESLQESLPLLREGQDVHFPYLGVVVAPMGVIERGALITYIDPAGPAGRGGVRAGDRVLSVDGASVDSVYRFPMLLSLRKPGDPLRLGMERGGKAFELSVILGRRPGE